MSRPQRQHPADRMQGWNLQHAAAGNKPLTVHHSRGSVWPMQRQARTSSSSIKALSTTSAARAGACAAASGTTTLASSCSSCRRSTRGSLMIRSQFGRACALKRVCARRTGAALPTGPRCCSDAIAVLNNTRRCCTQAKLQQAVWPQFACTNCVALADVIPTINGLSLQL